MYAHIVAPSASSCLATNPLTSLYEVYFIPAQLLLFHPGRVHEIRHLSFNYYLPPSSNTVRNTVSCRSAIAASPLDCTKPTSHTHFSTMVCFPRQPQQQPKKSLPKELQGRANRNWFKRLMLRQRLVECLLTLCPCLCPSAWNNLHAPFRYLFCIILFVRLTVSVIAPLCSKEAALICFDKINSPFAAVRQINIKTG